MPCAYCKEHIVTKSRRQPGGETAIIIVKRLANVNWMKDYFHVNCYMDMITEDCPKYQECTEQAIENHVPDHNEGYE